MKAIDSALWRAAQRSDTEGIGKALKAGADPNLKIDGTPLLYMLAIAGRVDDVKLFIDAKADLEIREPQGRTPLAGAAWVAISERQYQVVDQLIAAGADVNAKEISGIPIIEIASQFSNYRSVNRLLNAGAAMTPRARRFLGNKPGPDLPGH